MTGCGRRSPRMTPSCPWCSPAEHTEQMELGTAIAVAFARSPMQLAYTAHDLQAYSGGRFILGLGSQIKPHIERRFSMPWSHPAPRMREFVMAMRAIWSAWNDGTKLSFRGDFYTAHADDPVLLTAARTGRRTRGLPGRGRGGHDRGGRRGRRRPAGARVLHRALPARGDAPRAFAQAWPRRGGRGPTSRSACWR